MERDRFSRTHPAVTFAFFVVAIGLGAMIMHPAYIIASGVAASSYYCLIKGHKGLKLLLLSIPLFIFLSLFNPPVLRRGRSSLREWAWRGTSHCL